MKTDKLYYQIFLEQPALLAELIPGLPADCQFEYVAPVVKESEFRLDGLLMPQRNDPAVPVVFLEAQMQPDSRFYGRYFAEIFVYLYQYQIQRQWQGLLILQARSQPLGSELPYADLLSARVHRIYLQDLLNQTQLTPALALLQLLVLPDEATATAAKDLLETARSQGDSTFRTFLSLVEAILISKFPQLSTQEILGMLDIKTTDIRQTRFYREVYEEGREEGREAGREEGREAGERSGQVKLLIPLLEQRLGTLTDEQAAQIRSLSLSQLAELSKVVLELADLAALSDWLQTPAIAATPSLEAE
jgi:predicted transposase/invertase (TIGR01784 family)